MTEIDDVTSLFKKGLNCAQSLLSVYGKAFGVDHEMAVKIAAAFGGGMGKTGDTCGAVTGALMVIGLKYGSADLRNTDAEIETYEIARTFIEKFQSRNKSTICRDLIGFDINSLNDNTKDKERIIMNQCPNYVRDAAEIIEEIL